jgi:hypothetical protein
MQNDKRLNLCQCYRLAARHAPLGLKIWLGMLQEGRRTRRKALDVLFYPDGLKGRSGQHIFEYACVKAASRQ